MGAGPIPVIRHRQKDTVIYLGHLTVAQARQVVFADHYPPAPGRAGYQRPPDQKRAQSFARYLEESPAGFMTPVLLNARRPVRFIPSEAESNVGQLVLEGESTLAIVDGQHRSLGLLDFFGDDGYPVPFMLFDVLPIHLEEQLFSTINREQKRVSMSHVHFVSRHGDPLAEMVSRLESDPDSPWYHRVNLVGAKGTKRPVSLQSLRTGLEALLQAGELKVLSFEEQYAITRGFWRVVSEVWPTAWAAPRNSLLTKSMGTLAVAKLGGYLLPRCLISDRGEVRLDEALLATHLTRASGVDWMSDGTFKGYSGRHGADLIKHYVDGLIFGHVGVGGVPRR